jgi:hypothetical protein
VQLRKQDRLSIRSLLPSHLEALAQLGRLLGTVVRDEKVAEGAMLYWNELLKIHNKMQREKAEEGKKVAAKAKKQKDQHPLTWKEMLKNPPSV